MKNMKKLIMTFLFLFAGVSNAANNNKLLTPAKSFKSKEPIIATSFFHWLSANGGQMLGPWLPLEGRKNWTGETDWWKSQIKQTMRAGIDVLYVHLISQMEPQRINLFRALAELRQEGYDVPKIVPFLDPIVTWGHLNKYSLAIASNKMMIANEYIRFFDQYFSVNTDKFATDYIAKIDNKIVLDIWHVWLNFSDISTFRKIDIEKPLAEKFGKKYPAFTNGIYLITTAMGESFTFADEKVVQFHSQKYFDPTNYKNVKTVQLKPGYWDQNHRTPGYLLKRDGGVHYINAWKKVLTSSVDHVYIESWNEYTEGTGIYAADPTNIFKINSNTNDDVWSSTNDPFEYIKTTYDYGSKFKKLKKRNAKILWHNLPSEMKVGETNHCTIYVRNTGSDLWNSKNGYCLSQRVQSTNFVDINRQKMRALRMHGLIDDKKNEVDFYGGIFKGRPVKFSVKVIAPDKIGKYKTYWQMMKGKNEWFGQVITNIIHVRKR